MKKFLIALIILLPLIVIAQTNNVTSEAIKTDEVKVDIIELVPFTIAGLHLMSRDITGDEVSKFWEVYEEKKDEYKTDSTVIWGAKFNIQEKDGTTFFNYLIGLDVTGATDIPQKYRVMNVPAHTYAVFVHKGSIVSTQKTYDYIYKTWFKQNDYIIDLKAAILEKQQESKDGSGTEILIYIPITPYQK